ncbi:MAG: glycosyltransferase family 2 protein [Candidatus Omnitrophota bacterium]
MEKICCIVITYNEERNIGECLRSVKWADDVVVVDAFSTDRTAEIAEGHNATVFREEWQGYGAQRNFGLSKSRCEWVFFIDADERVPDVLASEIKERLDADKGLYDGYYIPRRSFYLGRWIRYGEWQPDLKLRLVRKGAGEWSSHRVHEEFVLGGEAGLLGNFMEHYTYRDIRHHMEKFNLYSTLSAHDMLERREKVRCYHMLTRPCARFLKGYIFKQGFKDGFAGLVIAVMQSFEVFLRYSKLREIGRLH